MLGISLRIIEGTVFVSDKEIVGCRRGIQRGHDRGVTRIGNRAGRAVPQPAVNNVKMDINKIIGLIVFMGVRII